MLDTRRSLMFFSCELFIYWCPNHSIFLLYNLGILICLSVLSREWSQQARRNNSRLWPVQCDGSTVIFCCPKMASQSFVITKWRHNHLCLAKNITTIYAAKMALHPCVLPRRASKAFVCYQNGITSIFVVAKRFGYSQAIFFFL